MCYSLLVCMDKTTTSTICVYKRISKIASASDNVVFSFIYNRDRWNLLLEVGLGLRMSECCEEKNVLCPTSPRLSRSRVRRSHNFYLSFSTSLLTQQRVHRLVSSNGIVNMIEKFTPSFQCFNPTQNQRRSTTGRCLHQYWPSY